MSYSSYTICVKLKWLSKMPKLVAGHKDLGDTNFCVMLTVHLSLILDNDQRDAHLLYFTIYLLHSSTCFEHYMPIIRRLNCIDSASGIVLSVSDRPCTVWERTGWSECRASSVGVC